MGHQNNGVCISCAQIINRYPNFFDPLRIWFQALQFHTPEIHVSSAGRGKIDQEALFSRGATRAHYGESAHNWNIALDLFFQINGEYNLDRINFEKSVVPSLNDNLVWYGDPKAVFKELPHVEWAGWNDMAHRGLLNLVE